LKIKKINQKNPENQLNLVIILQLWHEHFAEAALSGNYFLNEIKFFV